MQFSSSRTFPGHRCWVSHAWTSSVHPSSGRPCSAHARTKNARAQGHDVGGAVAQGRDADGDDGEAVPEVLAKAPRRDLRLQVAVGGREDAHIHLTGLAAAHPQDLAFLQHAQQLGLEVGAGLSDLVQQQRAPVGPLEDPLAGPRRPREGALVVAEQLRLQHPVGERGAVDCDEGAPHAVAVQVDRAGHHLLAGGHRGGLRPDLRLAGRPQARHQPDPLRRPCFLGSIGLLSYGVRRLWVSSEAPAPVGAGATAAI
jgi:hypothetical protein